MDRRAGQLVLGVTGGIAAYKAAELLRMLQKRSFDVRVVMTRNACEFIGVQTFAALSANPVITEMFGVHAKEPIGHISLAEWADAVIVAPATANIIGKFTYGIADDFLSTFLLAFQGPVLIAPAMNPKMYASPSVQSNLTILRQRQVWFAGPDSGDVACGHFGPGRMSDPGVIADLTCAMLGQHGDLSGKRILVTAGPTREPIDPVRYISNRSSGKMGFAIAAAAVERGAVVDLISGPTGEKPHAALDPVKVTTADQMYEAVMASSNSADGIIMAAAVSDWKPLAAHTHKWKKGPCETTSLDLVQNKDILSELTKKRKPNQVIVGFAAETSDLEQEAGRKLKTKNLDAIVANDVSESDSGFDVDSNSGVILDRFGNRVTIPRCSKREMADRILDSYLTLSRQLDHSH